MDEKLKELLEKATQNYLAVKDENEKLAKQVQDLITQQDELKTAIEAAKTPEDIQKLQETIEDLKLQMENVVGKSRNNGIEMSADEKQKMHESVLKPIVGQWLKGKQRGTDPNFFSFVKSGAVEQFKVLNITNPEAGGAAVAEILSRDVIEYAREFSPVLSLAGRNPLMTRNYRQLVLVSYPSVGAGIENVAGTAFPETSTPTYKEVKSHVFKVEANPRITDEAMYGLDIDLYSELVRLVGDEITIYLSAQIWYGNGADKNARGILSSNRVNATESVKPTLDPVAANMRSPEHYPIVKSGVAGAFGSNNISSCDFFITVKNKLPTKYLQGAYWMMNRNSLDKVEKLRDNDGNPVFIRSLKEGGAATILGFPVVIDDTMPNPVANANPIIFGRLDQAYFVNDGDIDYMLLNPYKIKGCTIVEYSKEMFEMVGKTDAIIVMSLSA